MMQDVQELEPDHDAYDEVPDHNPVADDGPEEEVKVGQKVKKTQNLFQEEPPEYRKLKQMKMAGAQELEEVIDQFEMMTIQREN